jgi:biopolymer transport protein ExbD
MQFATHKRKQPPMVIIVSLIDVLIVVLIFLMVTTSFKQTPAIKLALPESRQAKAGAAANMLIVTVPKQGPIYLKSDPVTVETFQERLIEAVHQNPDTTLAIRADTDTPVGMLVKVMDAAKAANLKVPPSLFTKTAQ